MLWGGGGAVNAAALMKIPFYGDVNFSRFDLASGSVNLMFAGNCFIRCV